MKIICINCYNMYCQCRSCPGVLYDVCVKEWEGDGICHHNPDTDKCLGFISEPVNIEVDK